MSALHAAVLQAKKELDKKFDELVSSLENQQAEMNIAREHLEVQQTDLDTRESKLNALAKKLEDRLTEFKEEEELVLEWQHSTTDPIPLNVGGEIIQTDRTTLTSIPSSLLAAIFSGRHESTRGKFLPIFWYLFQDGKQNFFFDRDPDVFKYLLQYLRTGKLVSTLEQGLSEMIRDEFNYFCVPFPTSSLHSLPKVSYPSIPYHDYQQTFPCMTNFVGLNRGDELMMWNLDELTCTTIFPQKIGTDCLAAVSPSSNFLIMCYTQGGKYVCTCHNR